VDDYIWTFSRGEQQLQIRRRPVPDGHMLEMTSDDGPPRSYFFADFTALVVFQSDMEAFLLRTGWSFVAFTPERRAGVDRRGWPRLDERRRWWTDGRQHEPDQATRNRRGRKPPAG
jgi:hypothetical protein